MDQESLTEANLQLMAMGLSKIKVRVTIDCTGKGSDGAVHAARFAYPGLRSGVDMVVRGAVLGDNDVSRYFHSFPWALYAGQYEGRIGRTVL